MSIPRSVKLMDSGLAMVRTPYGADYALDYVCDTMSSCGGRIYKTDSRSAILDSSGPFRYRFISVTIEDASSPLDSTDGLHTYAATFKEAETLTPVAFAGLFILLAALATLTFIFAGALWVWVSSVAAAALFLLSFAPEKASRKRMHLILDKLHGK